MGAVPLEIEICADGETDSSEKLPRKLKKKRKKMEWQKEREKEGKVILSRHLHLVSESVVSPEGIFPKISIDLRSKGMLGTYIPKESHELNLSKGALEELLAPNFAAKRKIFIHERSPLMSLFHFFMICSEVLLGLSFPTLILSLLLSPQYFSESLKGSVVKNVAPSAIIAPFVKVNLPKASEKSLKDIAPLSFTPA